MSTATVSLNENFTTPLDITLPVIDPTLFAVLPATPVTDTTNESSYRLMDGDADYPMTMRMGVYKNPKANNGIGATNVSAKVSNFAQKTDEDDVIWTLPETWTLAKSAPGGNPFYDFEADVRMIGLLVSAYIHFTAGIAGDAIADQLKFGVVNMILTHEQTGLV